MRLLVSVLLIGVVLALAPFDIGAAPARKSPTAATEGGVGDCLQASAQHAADVCRDTARSIVRDYEALLSLGEDLQQRQRFAAAVAVFSVGVGEYPNDWDLIRHKVLAESDLREHTWLGLNKGQDSADSSAITRELAAIRCAARRPSDPDADCRGADTPPIPAPSSTGVQPGRDPELAISALRAIPPRPQAVDTVSSRVQAVRRPAQQAFEPSGLSDAGRAYALVIGNDRYVGFPSLETARADAQALAGVLRSTYGFETEVLLDADRATVLSALYRLRSTLSEHDELLIYYAGHGYLDRQTQRGYWLPVDADEHSPANWISTSDINDMLLGMSVGSALVVADSCYAGSLADAQVQPATVAGDGTTRLVMTSGGLEPVLDNAFDGHSAFAGAVLAALKDNRATLSADELFAEITHQVQRYTDQTPQFSALAAAGHTGGTFLFTRFN